MSGVAPSPILSDIKALYQSGLLDFLGDPGFLGQVSDEAAMLALGAEQGQFCYRADTASFWDCINTAAAGALGGWQERGADVVGSEVDLWGAMLGDDVDAMRPPFGYVSPRAHGDTTTTGFGLVATTYASSSAAVTGAYANTNVVTRAPRNTYASSVATADNITGLRFPLIGYLSNVAGRGGMKGRLTWAANDPAPVANAMCYAGTRATATDTVGTIDVATGMVNTVGFGAARGESVLSLWHNDSSGSPTKIVLTDGPNGVGGTALNWPAHDTTELYTATFENPPGTLDWTLTLKRHSTGQTYTKTLIYGTDTTDLPGADTVQVMHLFRGSGSTALATNIAWVLAARGDLTIPAVATGVGGTFDVASQAEAEAGVNNVKGMTPLRSKQQIDARVASQAEAEAGTDATKLMTPVRVAQAIAALAPDGGSGGEIIGSGPNDITALTVALSGPEAGKVNSYNDGAPHTITFVGGAPTEDVITGAVKRTLAPITDTPYFRVAGSQRYRGGAYSCMLADRNEMMAAVNAATMSIDLGWAIRVLDVGGIRNPDGSPLKTPGARATFNGEFFSWDKPVPYRDLRSIIHTGSATESGVLRSLSIPATIPNIRSSILIGVDYQWGTAATLGTKTARIKVNGNPFYTANALATSNEWFLGRKSLRMMGALNAQRSMSNNVSDAATGTTSSADVNTYAIDTALTALTIDTTMEHANAADSVTLFDLFAYVYDDEFPLA